ncbi:M15 family peptidase [Moraxella lacunata]|uniref:Endolysin n=1 Tax=Moraxella lacunata TaxID=477 RepID=A0A1B8Q815_MORLA|nr:M15 family metallopeptidase [Moraxella lacunata]MDI4482785.1 M15 family peptidase [Moraxella lacunata]MDI4507258.1 M15 family peptidase [Moraxella lacunata]OBX61399.1 endolysin [Moraxella lacunata]OBX67251.1 endolysin [Moraxella lacunata]
MSYVLSKRSLNNLNGVHPSLVAIVKRAISKGRTVAQCLAKGIPAKYANPKHAKVTWLSNPFASKHCKQADGYGHAVDICPYPVDWSDLKKFDAIAKAMFDAERQLIAENAIPKNTKLRWGADWNRNGKPRERGESDSPHFEIF